MCNMASQQLQQCIIRITAIIIMIIMTACQANKQRMMCASVCVSVVRVCVSNLYAAQADTLLTTKNFSSFIMQDEMLAAMSVKHCTHTHICTGNTLFLTHTQTHAHAASLSHSAPSLSITCLSRDDDDRFANNCHAQAELTQLACLSLSLFIFLPLPLLSLYPLSQNNSA